MAKNRSDTTQTTALWLPGVALARLMDEKAAAVVEGAVMANIEFAQQFANLALGRTAPLQAAQAVAVAALKPAMRRDRD